MPYFVYRISKDKKNLTELNDFDKFITAKEFCRDLRKKQPAGGTDTIRMVHAKNKKEAKMLLSEKHKPSSPLEEWEV